jgi:hypothetical protein
MSQQPRKANTLFIIGTVVSTIGCALWISSIISNQQSGTSQTGAVQATPTPAKIGNAIILDGISCIVNDATIDSVNGDIGDSISFTVNITNKSQSEYHYFLSDFHIQTNQGIIIDPENSPFPVSGALAPGGQTSTLIFFTGVIDPQKAKLLWQSTGHADELDHAWLLSQIKASN